MVENFIRKSLSNYLIVGFLYSTTLFLPSYSYCQSVITFNDLGPANNLDSIKNVVEFNSFDDKTLCYNILKLQKTKLEFGAKVGPEIDKIIILNKKLKSKFLQACYFHFKAVQALSIDHKESFKYSNLAIKDFEALNDYGGLIISYINLLNISVNSNDKPITSLENTKNYYDKIIQYGRTSKSPFDKVRMYLYFSTYNKKYYKTSLKSVKDSLDKAERTLNKYYPNVLNFYLNLNQKYVDYYYDIKNIKKVIEYHYKTLNYILPHNDYPKAVVYLNVGSVYEETNDFSNAKKAYLQAIGYFTSGKVNDIGLHGLINDRLASIHYLTKNFEKAYQYKVKSDSLNYELQQIENSKKYLELEARLNLKTKEQENIKLKVEKNKEIADKERFKNIIIIVLLFLLLALIFAYFQFKTSQKLKKAFGEIQDLQKERERFFTILAHDLKSPINSLVGMDKTVQYLLNKGDLGALDRLGKKIDETSFNLSLLINNLLQWGLTKQAEVKNNFNEIELNKLAENLLPIYNDIASFNNNNLIFEKTEPIIINSNKSSIETILRNLLDNALKNAKAATSVYVKIFELENQVTISVKNEFEKIDREKIERIEKLFADTENWEPGQGGLGLGLIISKQMSKIIGAQLNLKISKYDIEFSLNIPN